MKKLLIGITSVAVIGVGGVFVTAQIGEENSKEEPKEVVAASAIEETQEVIDIPTERTVDMVNEDPPWYYFSTDKIEEFQSQGETVYLYDDAEPLEDYILEMNGQEGTEDITKEEMIKPVADYLKLFIAEISQYVDNQAYIDKLKEVEQSMVNEQYDAVPKLIEEAKTLRESK